MDLYKVRQQLSLGIPLTNLNLRVTDYSRVSTTNIRQKTSLQNQIEHFDDMIKKNENWIYVKGYVDNGITGTIDIKRDNFMRMIEDGKKGKFDLIITKEISRFSRNTLDSIKYTRELLQHGVAVFFVNDNINTALPDSELRLTIMASMAQDEIRRLSERVKFGMNQAITNGHILGNDTLFGYNKNLDTGNLEINNEEAEILRRIYSMYVIDDKSLTKIANTLNKENIKTSKDKKFTASTLSRFFRNPKYKGYYCGKKSEVIDYMTKKIKKFEQDEWVMYVDHERVPPIITEEMWDKAFLKLKKNSRKFGKKTNDENSKILYQRKYPLSSKIFCSEHNTVFYRRKMSKKGNEIVWGCSEYYDKGKDYCDTPLIRQSELYSIFGDIIKKLSINLEEVTNMLLKLYQSNKNSICIEEQIKKLNRSIENVEVRKDKLLDLNITGSLSNIEFKEKNDNYNVQIADLKDKIQNLLATKKNFEDVEKKNKKLEKILKQKSVSESTKEKLIELLLNKIIVSTINSDKNDIELKIFFNFSEEYIHNEITNNLVTSVESIKNILREDYEFKRGYDKTGTKRYIVKYKINCYMCL